MKFGALLDFKSVNASDHVRTWSASLPTRRYGVKGKLDSHDSAAWLPFDLIRPSSLPRDHCMDLDYQFRKDLYLGGNNKTY